MKNIIKNFLVRIAAPTLIAVFILSTVFQTQVALADSSYTQTHTASVRTLVMSIEFSDGALINFSPEVSTGVAGDLLRLDS